MTNLVLQRDAEIADWTFKTCNVRPMQYEMALGLEEAGKIVGSIMFTNYNGSDVEVHFVGPKKLTRGVVRLIFGIAALQFNVNRVTVRTRKDHMARGVKKLGAIYEGTVRRLYGPTDGDNHAGQQFAFFRETINRLAGIKEN